MVNASAKVNVSLSLREVRAVLRAVEMASHVVFDRRAPFGIENQSEVYRALCDAESTVSYALGEFAAGRPCGECGAGFRLAYRWRDEPIAKPFSKEVA